MGKSSTSEQGHIFKNVCKLLSHRNTEHVVVPCLKFIGSVLSVDITGLDKVVREIDLFNKLVEMLNNTNINDNDYYKHTLWTISNLLVSSNGSSNSSRREGMTKYANKFVKVDGAIERIVNLSLSYVAEIRTEA